MSKVIRSQFIQNVPSSSGRGDYKVEANHNDEGHAYLSCNCPAWTRGAANKGKHIWERYCKHTSWAAASSLTRIRLFDDTLTGRVTWWLQGVQVASPMGKVGIVPAREKSGRKQPQKPAEPKPEPTVNSARFDALEL